MATGPDLTDVGRNPSGYLLESIVNPNAMIVDGSISWPT
jgi:hypothetical protein